MKKMPAIKVSEETYRRLMRIKGLIETLERREASMDDVVAGLLNKSKFEDELLGRWRAGML